MQSSFDVTLLRRAIGTKRRHRSVRSLYGHHTWAEDLDIVNELGGHTGCVNALSWSQGGGLLASGSDDTYLNIWAYNPANLSRPFTLSTSVSTGHSANIFSVKFMPHSNDRTVVTCAGDSEVRVFDLEYNGTSQANEADNSFAASTRSRRFNDFFPNTRWLSDSNTNARVYRSHADRAKRIVTESSPHLFLTCSEDGEVRQWDLRLPSSAYPAPRNGRGLARFHRIDSHGSDNIPPPLISYKKYNLDLNSISCAASQPQYIALGGAHLHCFLHDRRMLGRDLTAEAGQTIFRKPVVGTYEDDSMGTATRCVKRLAPNGKRRMKTRDRGHITACKISDANPNEMIASWSGDHIYSFDIIKSPDARDADTRDDETSNARRLRHQDDRKRKRKAQTTSSGSLAENANPSQRLRRVSSEVQENGQTALHLRYANGEADDLVLVTNDPDAQTLAQNGNNVLLSEAQRVAERVARSLIQLRKTLFDFSATLAEGVAESMENSSDLTPYTNVFTTALGQCSSILPDMDEVIRLWSYPIDPSSEEVTFQNTLRHNRQASWRFVQAAGCLSRILGGKLQTLSSAPDPRLARFQIIQPAVHEGKSIRRSARFHYDFLKAVICWLDGGQEAILKAFKRPANVSAESLRFPFDDTVTIHNCSAKLYDYLSDLADEEKPVINLDANRFERNETRIVFDNQKSAVRAFTRALADIRLEMRHGFSQSQMSKIEESPESSTKRVMDRGAAARFWGVKVGRSLLMEAAEAVVFDFVNQAFGGSQIRVIPESLAVERSQQDVNADTEEVPTDHMDILTALAEGASVLQPTPSSTIWSSESPQTTRDTTEGSNQSTTEIATPPTVTVQDAEEGYAIEDEETEAHESEDEGSESGDESDAAPAHPFFRRRGATERSTERSSVNSYIPYSTHSRVYKGHCNTRTVKDVNYYGPNDEYVVSGSDDGHFFIWDRKTSKIVNILHGDGEVVNVVQGHPYEPMIACSGIDSSIKIFGPGGKSREREAASRGIDVANPGGSVHSSLRMGGRRARRARDDSDDDNMEEEDDDEAQVGTGTERKISLTGLKSRRALHKSYEITSQNDAERRRGMGDTFVTEGMLARFAAAIQRGQIQGVAGQGFGATGGTIVVDDNCEVSLPLTAHLRLNHLGNRLRLCKDDYTIPGPPIDPAGNVQVPPQLILPVEYSPP